MKCIGLDLRRALAGRWFWAAAAAMLIALWLSVGDQTYYLMDSLDMGYAPDFAGMFRSALTGQVGMLTLPALSALPFAAQALGELRSGAARNAVFRAGRRAYTAGHTLACAASGALAQAAAFTALYAVLSGIAVLGGAGMAPLSAVAEALPLLLGRMLCGGLWACAGCAVALLTQTASAAYIAPLCLCYTLMMVGTRFFPDQAWLNPMNWPGARGAWLALACAGAFLIALAALQREVRRYV